jgi:hypothetical protein
MGPPSRTSTLISEGCEGAGFACCAGLEQLTKLPANPIASIKKNIETGLALQPTRFIPPPSLVSQIEDNQIERKHNRS